MSDKIYGRCRVERVYGRLHREVVLELGQEDILLEALARHIKLKRPGNFSLWYSPASNQLILKPRVMPKKQRTMK